jgi:benzodiazapine receptor
VIQNRILSLLVFLAIVLGGGTLIGFVTAPGDWYASLQKPWFNPPNWIFAPVWTLLYIAIAIAGWRTYLRRPGGTSMAIWSVQLILNLTWSPVFFGLHMVGLALIVIIFLLAAIVAFVVATWRVDRPSSLLFVPYAAWVTFATALNISILLMN